MNNGFSLTQLMENIFVPDAYASSGLIDSGLCPCFPSGYWCAPTWRPEIGCFPDMDYGCDFYPLDCL